MNTRKLTLAAIFAAIIVALSWFNIPIAGAKAYPIQHLMNVLAGVILGPFYGALIAIVASTIRVAMGTGTILAYPGSIIGAVLAGLAYRKTKAILPTIAGEVLGTGLVGGLVAYGIGRLVLGSEAGAMVMVVAFGISSIAGSILAAIILLPLNRQGFLKRIKEDLERV